MKNKELDEQCEKDKRASQIESLVALVLAFGAEAKREAELVMRTAFVVLWKKAHFGKLEQDEKSFVRSKLPSGVTRGFV